MQMVAMFVTIMPILVVLMGAGPLTRWKQNDPHDLLRRLRLASEAAIEGDVRGAVTDVLDEPIPLSGGYDELELAEQEEELDLRDLREFLIEEDKHYSIEKLISFFFPPFSHISSLHAPMAYCSTLKANWYSASMATEE